MSAHAYSEDQLVEQPAIELFRSMKWETLNCFHEFEQAGGSPLGRDLLLPKLISGEVEVDRIRMKDEG